MTAQTRTVLKGKFETGDKPTQTDYVDLIDSGLQLADTTAQSVASEVALAAQLIVDGVVSAKSRMFVAEQLEVSGQAIFSTNVSAFGDMHVSGRINTGEVSAQTLIASAITNTTTLSAAAGNFTGAVDIDAGLSAGSIVTDGTLNVQGIASAQGGLDVSGATKLGIVSAASITTSGAARIEGQATFLSELAVSTAAGIFATVTALTTTDQKFNAGFAEASAFDHFIRIDVCGRPYAIPLVSATF